VNLWLPRYALGFPTSCSISHGPISSPPQHRRTDELCFRLPLSEGFFFFLLSFPSLLTCRHTPKRTTPFVPRPPYSFSPDPSSPLFIQSVDQKACRPLSFQSLVGHVFPIFLWLPTACCHPFSRMVTPECSLLGTEAQPLSVTPPLLSLPFFFFPPSRRSALHAAHGSRLFFPFQCRAAETFFFPCFKPLC